MNCFRTILARLLLAVVALSVFDVLFEGLFLRFAVPALPLAYQFILPRPYRPLALHCKKGPTPGGDYVLLLGDSYAQGMGDWYLSTDATKREPFGSADVLFQKSGKDVLNFGHGGYSTVSALSLAPRAYYAYLDSSLFLDLAAPGYVVYYFYEGNDLTDNIRVLDELGLAATLSAEDLASYPVYKERIIDRLTGDNSYYLKGTLLHYAPQYLSLNILAALIKSSFSRDQESLADTPPTAGGINRIILGGEVTAIPDNLQGPALELSDLELRKSLAMVSSAFRDLKEQFHDARVVIVYLPSPLTTYRVAGQDVSTQSYFHRETVYPVAFLQERAARIEKEIQRYAAANGYAFLNIKADLRRAGTVVHGPKDWKHYNKIGYTILGTRVAGLVSGQAVTDLATAPKKAGLAFAGHGRS